MLPARCCTPTRAQVGAVTGSTVATTAARFGVPRLYACGGLSCLGVVGMVRLYVALFPGHLPAPPSQADRARSAKSPWSSMCQGLFLVLRYEYTVLLFGLSCLYEVVITVLDYEMKVIGRARYGEGVAAANRFAALMGHFGQATNTLSFLFSLFGFSYVVRSLGLRRTLRLFPVLLLLAVVLSWWAPGLWMLFAAMSFLKALTFSLNEPGIELLYMPTTDAIKFKAKAWIDVFGTRAMKAVGSAITMSGRSDPKLLVRYGSVPTFLISLALLGISIMVGRQFEDLLANGVVVGEDLQRMDGDTSGVGGGGGGGGGEGKAGHEGSGGGGGVGGAGCGGGARDASNLSSSSSNSDAGSGGDGMKPSTSSGSLDWSRPPPPTPPRVRLPLMSRAASKPARAFAAFPPAPATAGSRHGAAAASPPGGHASASRLRSSSPQPWPDGGEGGGEDDGAGFGFDDEPPRRAWGERGGEHGGEGLGGGGESDGQAWSQAGTDIVRGRFDS